MRKISVRKETVGEILGSFPDCLQSLIDELDEKLENMEERFSGTERYQRYQDVKSELEGLDTEFGDIPTEVYNIEVEYTLKTTKYLTNNDKLSNLLAPLSAVMDYLNEIDVHELAEKQQDHETLNEEEAEGFATQLEERIEGLTGIVEDVHGTIDSIDF